MHDINTCEICGSINVTKFKNNSNYNICYYCYTIKNKASKSILIENNIFASLLDDVNIDVINKKNIVSVNYEAANLLFKNNKNFNIENNEYDSLNSALQRGKIDLLIIPNIENINFNEFIKITSSYLSNNIDIFLGFYTSIKHFEKLQILESIKYIHNVYAISKILSQNNMSFYIHNFWEKNNYILLNINKIFNSRTENTLQKSFDRVFYSNFKQEINL